MFQINGVLTLQVNDTKWYLHREGNSCYVRANCYLKSTRMSSERYHIGNTTEAVALAHQILGTHHDEAATNDLATTILRIA